MIEHNELENARKQAVNIIKPTTRQQTQ